MLLSSTRREGSKTGAVSLDAAATTTKVPSTRDRTVHNATNDGVTSQSVHVAVLVRRHLRQAQHRVLALEAVVVRLLRVVVAALDAAVLRRRVLLEAGRIDAVQLGVLPPVRHHLVGVRAHELALEAVEVRSLVAAASAATGGPVGRSLAGRVRAVDATAVYVGAELSEVATHERVEALVSRRVLHKARLVAEAVAAVLARAVEMRLVLAVTAVSVAAVLVEAESHVAVWHRFILEDAEAGHLHALRLAYHGQWLIRSLAVTAAAEQRPFLVGRCGSRSGGSRGRSVHLAG